MNHAISLQQAIEMTTRFRQQRGHIVNPNAGKDILPTCETFDRAAFDTLLNQTGCVKIRIYSGLNPALQVRCIVVGVNEKDEDILPGGVALADSTDGTIVEEGQPCPPYCPTSSPLNP